MMNFFKKIKEQKKFKEDLEAYRSNKSLRANLIKEYEEFAAIDFSQHRWYLNNVEDAKELQSIHHMDGGDFGRPIKLHAARPLNYKVSGFKFSLSKNTVISHIDYTRHDRLDRGYFPRVIRGDLLNDYKKQIEEFRLDRNRLADVITNSLSSTFASKVAKKYFEIENSEGLSIGHLTAIDLLNESAFFDIARDFREVYFSCQRDIYDTKQDYNRRIEEFNLAFKHMRENPSEYRIGTQVELEKYFEVIESLYFFIDEKGIPTKYDFEGFWLMGFPTPNGLTEKEYNAFIAECSLLGFHAQGVKDFWIRMLNEDIELMEPLEVQEEIPKEEIWPLPMPDEITIDPSYPEPYDEAFLSYRFRSKNDYIEYIQRTVNWYKNTYLNDILINSLGSEIYIPSESRLRHTYILGGSGSGKTELLKQMVWSDSKQDVGVLVLDPHGDFVDQCSLFQIFNDSDFKDKLVFLTPTLVEEGFLPTYNPLEHQFHDLSEFEKRNQIALKAGQLTDAFQVIFQREFTHNMQFMVLNCLRLLMEYREMTLVDLLNLLRPETFNPYLDKIQNHWDEELRLYFQTTFQTKQLALTKNAVLTRFGNAMTNQILKHMLCSKKSSFNLTKLLDEGKVVLLNASQGYLNEEGTKILGSFFMAEITAHGLSRAKKPEHQRKPIYIYLDECQNFVSPKIDKILSEARKYGLHLTLANQYLGQLGESLKKSVLANTEVKFCGKSSYADQSVISREIGFDISKISNLEQGKFVAKLSSTSKPIVLKGHDFLVNRKSKSYMDFDAHKILMERQMLYYSSLGDIRAPNKEIVESLDMGEKILRAIEQEGAPEKLEFISSMSKEYEKLPTKELEEAKRELEDSLMDEDNKETIPEIKTMIALLDRALVRKNDSDNKPNFDSFAL